MSGRVCEREGCEESLEGMRPEARFHSPACRAAASRQRTSRPDEETTHLRLASPVLAAAAIEAAEPPEPWRTTKQTAEHFGVSVRTVERWLAAGLPCWHPRRLGRVLIKLSICEAWLDEPEATTGAAAGPSVPACRTGAADRLAAEGFAS